MPSHWAAGVQPRHGAVGEVALSPPVASYPLRAATTDTCSCTPPPSRTAGLSPSEPCHSRHLTGRARGMGRNTQGSKDQLMGDFGYTASNVTCLIPRAKTEAAVTEGRPGPRPAGQPGPRRRRSARPERRPAPTAATARHCSRGRTRRDTFSRASGPASTGEGQSLVPGRGSSRVAAGLLGAGKGQMDFARFWKGRL